jgi:methyltransferase
MGVIPVSAYLLLIGLVILQRLAELAISKQHEIRLRARGAVEVGRGHYPWLVAMHTAFFVVLLLEIMLLSRRPAAWWWLPFIAFLLAQALRIWSMVSLGERWTTRLLILPGTAPVHRGPYRYFRHPNYLVIIVELASLPLISQAYLTAAVFTILNAVLLSIRIPIEERALAQAAGEPEICL